MLSHREGLGRINLIHDGKAKKIKRTFLIFILLMKQFKVLIRLDFYGLNILNAKSTYIFFLKKYKINYHPIFLYISI
jgi:hypothetical protein